MSVYQELRDLIRKNGTCDPRTQIQRMTDYLDDKIASGTQAPTPKAESKPPKSKKSKRNARPEGANAGF